MLVVCVFVFVFQLTGRLGGDGVLDGDESEGGADDSLGTTAIFAGQRAESVFFLAGDSLDDSGLDLLGADGARVEQRDRLDLGGHQVGDGRDGRVALDAVAALVGQLGLDHGDQVFGLLNSVVGRAATDDVTLFNHQATKRCVNTHLLTF